LNFDPLHLHTFHHFRLLFFALAALALAFLAAILRYNHRRYSQSVSHIDIDMASNFLEDHLPFHILHQPLHCCFVGALHHIFSTPSLHCQNGISASRSMVISITTVSAIFYSFTFATTCFLQLSSATTATITSIMSFLATESVLLRISFTVNTDGS
jgi:hypothetical protein